tara:strand:+ start:2562 stop:3224 length:663 start_codon:yes stop_codon:yes gene_type:complete
MFEAQNIAHLKNDWISLVFFIILIILAIIKFQFNDRLQQTATFFLSKKKLLTYFNKEKNIFNNLYQLLFFTVQLLTISLLIYFLSTFLQVNNKLSDVKLFFAIIIIVFLYFTFRFLIGLFIAAVFDQIYVFKKAAYFKMNYFNNLVLCLIPFLLLTAYSKNLTIFFLKITVFSCILFLLIRYFLFIKNNKKLIINNLFYFILYLCALEIVPLVIILKLTL